MLFLPHAVCLCLTEKTPTAHRCVLGFVELVCRYDVLRLNLNSSLREYVACLILHEHINVGLSDTAGKAHVHVALVLDSVAPSQFACA